MLFQGKERSRAVDGLESSRALEGEDVERVRAENAENDKVGKFLMVSIRCHIGWNNISHWCLM